MDMRLLSILSVVVAVHGKVCDLLDYGAVGDGTTLNTAAIAKAVTACCASQEPSTVVASKGTFYTASIELTCSHLTLEVQPGATILGSNNQNDYKTQSPLPSYGKCRDTNVQDSSKRYMALIFGTNVTDIKIQGGGTVDGNGAKWWARHGQDGGNMYGRPRLIEIMYGERLEIRNLHLKDSAFWTVHPYASKDIIVSGLKITAPFYSPNTDGVDPDSCSNVLIENCEMSLGDDGVAIKSGLNEQGIKFGVPTTNVTIRNLTITPPEDNLSTNGISIGSEMSGGISDIFVSDVFIKGVRVGLFIKSNEGRGGYVKNINYQNITLVNALQTIVFSMTYELEKTPTELKDIPPPVFDGFHLTDIKGTNCSQVGDFGGLPESPLNGVHLKNINVQGKLGYYCIHANVTAEGTMIPKLPLICKLKP